MTSSQSYNLNTLVTTYQGQDPQGDNTEQNQAAQFTDITIDVNYPPVPLVAAKGDNITDDSAAINGCINYLNSLGGGKLLFTSKTYLHSQSLIFGNTVTVKLEGKGLSNTTLNYTGTGWGIDSSSTSFANYTNVKIKGLTLKIPANCLGGVNGAYITPELDDFMVLAPSAGSSGTGIYIGPIANIAEVNWGKVLVSNCTTGTILNSDHVSIAHLQLFNNVTQIEIGSTGGAPTGISIQYLHCVSTLSTPGKALHIVKSVHTDLFTVHLEGNYSKHISIENSPTTFAGTMIESLSYSSGVTFSIEGDPAYIDIRGCSNWYASNITNPFGSTNAVGGGLVRYTVGSVMGSYTGPSPNNAYLALTDLFISVTGGTGVSISISARYAGTNFNLGSSFTGFIRKGTYINFGGFSVSPTVTVAYAG